MINVTVDFNDFFLVEFEYGKNLLKIAEGFRENNR